MKWLKGRGMRGDRLREIREKHGLSQADLAERVNLATQQILRYEAGKNLPSSAVLYALSRELEVSADYLLGLVDEPQGKISPNDLSPLEYKFLSAADHGDLEEMIRVALEIYKDHDQIPRLGPCPQPRHMGAQCPRLRQKCRRVGVRPVSPCPDWD